MKNWCNAKRKWPKWGDLIWAHMTNYPRFEMVMVGGFDQKPNMFFRLDEGQWKGLGSSDVNSCDYWCLVKPPAFKKESPK